MGHWAFGVQYIKTSFVLPILFKQAKLEWLLHDKRVGNVSTISMKSTKIDKLRSELINHGDETVGFSPDQVLQRFDQIVAELKESIDRIDYRIKVAVIVMTVYSILSVGLYALPHMLYLSLINFILELLIVMSMLIYSVIRIRRTIKVLDNVFPNECFMAWHIVNFSLVAFVSTLNRVTDVQALYL